jgi:hypothetical protein
MEKDLEERGSGPIGVLSRHLPRETEDTHTKNRITGVPAEVRTEDHTNGSTKQ